MSGRERYVTELKKFIDVHIYGGCGPYTCTRKNEPACRLMVEQKYRFYLSFENSLCDDYVTEKFFRMMHFTVLPVTYGGTDLDKYGAPPHSHIDAMKFGSPELLAKHLKDLQEDDAKYAEYFWWKDFYEVRDGVENRAQPYCDLCKRLHDPYEPPKVYEDMHKWWITDSHCKKLKTVNPLTLEPDHK